MPCVFDPGGTWKYLIPANNFPIPICFLFLLSALILLKKVEFKVSPLHKAVHFLI